MPVLSCNIRVNPQGFLSLDNQPSRDPEHNPANKAGVGEAVSQVPQVTHVVEEAHSINLFDFFPHKSHYPEDYDTFYG